MRKTKMFDGKTVDQANAMRRAISLLIDRQYIIDTIGQTEQQAYDSLFHHSSGMLPLWQARTTSSGQRLACTSPTWALRRK